MNKKDLQGNPAKQFTLWYKQTIENHILQPDAMVLSTSSRHGKPSSRIVLLKEYDESGFVFFTNYNSRKGKELKENPFASLLFYWAELHKQVRIEGKVNKISRKETEEYFNSRSFESRIGAWASDQSKVIKNRSVLDRKFSELEKKYKDGVVPIPPHWGGYILIPYSIEFWECRPHRLHDRIRYTRFNKRWKIDRLSP
ncbi:MAG: pyridoxamine 5'-phosphate oxidase [Ignavibacteria bacterium]